MPLIDMPLDQLQTYQGRNPRPADFDAYWDAALRELDATDPQPELVPAKEIAPRHSEAFDLWFTGVGGARVYAKYVRPKQSAGRNPAVLQFHGYTGHSGDFSSRLAWSGEGFCVAAMDCRGQGGRSEDRGAVKGTTYRGQIIRGLDDPDPRQLLFRRIVKPTDDVAMMGGAAHRRDVLGTAALPAAVERGGDETLAGPCKPAGEIAAVAGVAVELEDGRDLAGGFLGADIFRVDARAAHAGEPQVERLAMPRDDLRRGHELGLGVRGVEFLERGGPVGVEVRGAGIEAAVGLEFGQGFVDEGHGGSESESESESERERQGRRLESAAGAAAEGALEVGH